MIPIAIDGDNFRSDFFMPCLFCNKIEKKYKQPVGVEYVCGACVILLTSADVDSLGRCLLRAIEKDFPGQKAALEFFIKRRPGVERPKSVKRDFNRRRTSQSLRHR